MRRVFSISASVSLALLETTCPDDSTDNEESAYTYDRQFYEGATND